MRDDFPPTVKEILARRVGYRCSNPVCHRLTSGPQADPLKAVNVGVASHITAASPGGPQYDDSLTAEERSHPSNGVWLCQKCGKLVDNDAIRYPEPLLREWKRQAEEAAIREVEGGPARRHDAEAAWVVSGRRFERELEVRNLAAPAGVTFARTRYAAGLAWAKGPGVVEPFPCIGVFFAWTPHPIVGMPAKDELARWMDCNQRRYDPLRGVPFIPSPAYSVVPKGFVWDDAQHAYAARHYSRYLAVETAGWIEYGFYPAAKWEDLADRVYYAKVVGSFVAFLNFVRDLSDRFKIDTAGVGLGLALRGTAGKNLLAVREEGMRQAFHTQPPHCDALRFVRPPSEDDWTVDGVAAQAVDEILDHWSFAGGPWVGRPEFKGAAYEGRRFRERFQDF